MTRIATSAPAVFSLVRGTTRLKDPTGLPTQQSKGPVSVVSASGEVIERFQAGYMIEQGLKPLLTLDFFETKILEDLALKTRSFGSAVHFCVALLDVLETERTIAKGETMEFVNWLQEMSTELAKTPEQPQIELPENLDAFVKTLENYYGFKNIEGRELTGATA